MENIKMQVVDFTNIKLAIEVQRNIFPEDGLLNLLASLDRDIFLKETSLYYPDDHVKYYLAFVGDTPVGITGLYEYLGYDNEMWVGWFGVVPEYQTHGYGREILNWTMTKALEKGKKVLRLYTDEDENKQATLLYKKMGFTSEKYTAEKLSYNCYIYSKDLTKEHIPWNKRTLGLAHQSDLELVDDKTKQKIYETYEEKYFK